jgi:hypothetical protein
MNVPQKQGSICNEVKRSLYCRAISYSVKPWTDSKRKVVLSDGLGPTSESLLSLGYRSRTPLSPISALAVTLLSSVFSAVRIAFRAFRTTGRFSYFSGSADSTQRLALNFATSFKLTRTECSVNQYQLAKPQAPPRRSHTP